MEKFALITGASKGIGFALAHVFAQHGYSLLLIARNTSELEQLREELRSKYQCEAKVLSADLAKSASIDLIMTTFQAELPKLEVLVNNAGFGLAKKFSDMPYEDVEGMIEVNIAALTKLTYRVLPFMLAKKNGKILNVASVGGYSIGPYLAMYYASKAYVLSFSQALYEEYKEDNIDVSVLCPGMTKTSFFARAEMNNTLLCHPNIPMMSPETVATIGFNGLMAGKRVIVTGWLNKFFLFIMWLTPNFLLAKINAFLEKPKSL